MIGKARLGASFEIIKNEIQETLVLHAESECVVAYANASVYVTLFKLIQNTVLHTHLYALAHTKMVPSSSFENKLFKKNQFIC